MQTTVVFLTLLAAVLAYPRPQQPQAVLLSRSQDESPDGRYLTKYEVSDGTQFQESGDLERTNDGQDNVGTKTGFYRFQTPDGATYQVNYKADKYGFNAVGNGIPQPVQPTPTVFQ